MPTSRLWVAYVSAAFGLGFNSIMTLLVPLRAYELGASPALIGLLVAAQGLVPAAMAVVFGTIVDWLGPKRCFIIGVTLCAGFSSVYLAMTSVHGLLALQLFIGIGRSLAWVSSQTLVTNLTAKSGDESKANSRFGFFTSLGVMVGPLLAGGAASLVGLRVAFVTPFIVACAFILLGFALPTAPVEDDQEGRSSPRSDEDERAPKQKQLSAFIALVRMPAVQMILALSFIRVWTNISWQSFFPVLLTENGVTPAAIGTIASAMSIVAMIGSLATSRASNGWGPERLAIAAMTFSGLSLLGSAVFNVAPVYYIPAAFMGLAQGLSLPWLLSLTRRHVERNSRGAVLGARTSANQAAIVAAPLGFGLLVSILGLHVTFVVMGGVTLIVLWVLYQFYVRGQRVAETGAAEQTEDAAA